MSKRSNPSQSEASVVKRSRLYNSRVIRSEINDPSFRDGVLDVPSFINSRKFEIDQLEKSQLKAKYSKSSRVFQALPRRLRRRGASHNVKRIPKRLRNKAIREMISSNKSKKDFKENDSSTAKKKKKINAKQLYQLKLRRNLLKAVVKLNLMKILPSEKLLNKNLNIRSIIKILNSQINANNPNKKEINNTYGSYDSTGINQLADPVISKLKYSKRQKSYQWISTHIWHAKRFHMIKRWGWNIPYKPTQKSYRLTHRSYKKTGGLIFETSYEGKIIFVIDNEENWPVFKNFLQYFIQRKINDDLISGKQFYSGNFFGKFSEKNGYYEMISNGQMLINKFENTYRILIQFHPGDFQDIWNYCFDNLDTKRFQMNDCRYSLGSIDLMGPKSLSSLISILPFHPNFAVSRKTKQTLTISDFDSFGGQSIISFNISDPRFLKAPFRNSRKKPVDRFEEDSLLRIKELREGQFNNLEINNNLFSTNGRTKSYQNQMTIKQINSKRRNLDDPATKSITTNKDLTEIPVILLIDSDFKKIKLLAPWFWISPIWNSLVKIPRIIPGGLMQLNQISFELNIPHYPIDYPTTKQGFIENQLLGKEKLKTWEKKPTKKRLNYDKVLINDLDLQKYQLKKGELSDWFNCDWKYLQLLAILTEVHKIHNDNNKIIPEEWNPDDDLSKNNFPLKDIQRMIEILKSNQDDLIISNPVLMNFKNKLIKLKKIEEFKEAIEKNLNNNDINQLLKLKLPINKIKIKLINFGKIKTNARIYQIPDDFHDLIECYQKLEILKISSFDEFVENFDNKYLINCPTFENLIGYVTTGAFNLQQGHYTGIGWIKSLSNFKNNDYCIIRNPGSKTVRIGKFQLL